MKTQTNFYNNNLVLPKINDLSNNLKLIPLNKNAIKTILIFKEEMTSPKQKIIKEHKKSHLKLKSFFNNDTKNLKNNFPISTNELLSPISTDNKKLIFKNYIQNKYKKNEKIINYPIKLTKVKKVKQEKLMLLKPLKINTNFTNFFKSAERSYLNSKSSISEKTKYTNQTNLISEFNYHEHYLNEDIEELELERYDIFKDINLEESKILKEVTDFLRSKDNKLNQVHTKKETFYNSLENKINFIYDIIGVPCFKNHFIQFKFMENISNNLVETGIHFYLNKLRVRYQREIDEKEEKHKLDLVKEENNKKKKKKNEMDDEFENADQAFKEVIDKQKKISIKNENDYEIEDFFILKYIRFENVCISNEKERNSLKLFDKSKKSKYRLSILKQIIYDE